MICHILTLVCGLASSVIILINYGTFISSASKITAIFLLLIVGLFVALVAFSVNVMVTLFKDLKSLRNCEYISITGKVLRFKKNREPESGVQINDKPVVLILDTNQEITLIVNDNIMVGKIYQFNYLRNSKIAEVVKKIE